MSRHPPAKDDTDGGFLSRWSRRKTGADESGSASEPGYPDERSFEAPPPTPEESDQTEPVKTDEDMPDLETIDETTDMSDFFSPGVSEELRNQALRRLFRMAKFNVTDGLDDYNEDFRNFALLGDIVTSDMRHRMEMEQERRDDEEERTEVAHADESEQPQEAEAATGESAQTEPESDAGRATPAENGTDETDRSGEGDPESPSKAST